ncbi:transposase [Nonomuraea jabiensis]|uniref:Transposase n=1 Tax=Nonomuraea jabiensis TaxID=882448 RepID=A0A7W9LAS4_9ACTN|nr:transposase [Nonomuraea jabiensis]MBB5776758.1 transposase [Nonomuraea jabiensis]
MMVIGIDPPKRTHTAVAVDEVGCKKGERTVQARDHGHVRLLVWARKLAAEERVWAVVPVPPNRTAGERRGGRERGKSDAIDALAIARLALREPDLPTARLDEQTRPIRLLVDHREALVAERTRLINRVLWLVHDLDPDLAAAVTKLKQVTTRRKLTAQLQALPATTARRVALAQIALIDSLSIEIDAAEKELKPLVQTRLPRLMTIVGVNVVTAAKLLGEVGDITRFRSSAAFARHNGTAPIPVWSGNDDRHRLNPGGNRQLNTTLHRIAITQARCHEGARALLKRRQETTRDTTKGSFRVLKRHLSDVIYRALVTDHHAETAEKDPPTPCT